MNKCPIAVIIITYNEEPNLSHALQSVIDWAAQVFVVDSFSADKTMQIAQSFASADVTQRKFKSVGDQRNWAMHNLPIDSDWVFFLDADEQLSEEMKAEIADMLPDVADGINGFVTKVKFIYLGRWLKYGDLYRTLIRMVRRSKSNYIDVENYHEKMVVEGKVGRLEQYIIHDDHKTIKDWVEKQNHRIWLDACDRIEGTVEGHAAISGTNAGSVTLESGLNRSLRRLQARMPSLMRPFGQFIYRYIIKLGFLDGWPGFIYNILLQFWYPLMIEAMVLEMRIREKEENK